MSSFKKAYGRTDIEVVEQSTRYAGFFQVSALRFRHRRFDGSWSPLVNRELVQRGHAVAVLPYDPLRDEVIFIEQLRVGPLGTNENPWLLEIIAGMVAEGERASEVAIREAQEEAGCEILAFEEIGTFFSSPGGCSEQVTLFVAKADSSAVAAIGGLDDENEDIKVHRVPFVQACEWLNAKVFDNPPIWMTMMWLQLHRERLKQEWS